MLETLFGKEEYKMEFQEELIQILNGYDPTWSQDPLDGDEVETLINHLRSRLNLLNGNITKEEYETLEG